MTTTEHKGKLDLPPFPRLDWQETAKMSHTETAHHIADALRETGLAQRQSIYLIVEAIGRTAARQFLLRTEQIEAAGGLMLTDGSRRRTPGGVFFWLVFKYARPKRGRALPAQGQNRKGGMQQHGKKKDNHRSRPGA